MEVINVEIDDKGGGGKGAYSSVKYTNSGDVSRSGCSTPNSL